MRIEAEGRLGLERLGRYVLCPPLAGDHLTCRLKTPWSDGTTHLVLYSLEWIVLCARLIKEADFRCGC